MKMKSVCAISLDRLIFLLVQKFMKFHYSVRDKA